jgi:hypothetical protein
MATVSYSAGFTRNMGDYESLRIDIGVEGEPIGDENTAQAYNRLRDFVESRLLDEVAQVELDVQEVRKGIRQTGEYKRKVAQAAEKEESEGK